MVFGVPTAGHGPAAIGHNNPPPDRPPEAAADMISERGEDVEPFDLAGMLDPAILRLQFQLEHAPRLARRDELLAGAARFFEAVKAIADEDTQARAATFVQQFKAEWKLVEGLRAAQAKPFLEASRTVQDFFKAGILDRLDHEARAIEGKMTVFARQKADAARVAAEAEAKARAAEASALASAAERTMGPDALGEAARASSVATAAAKKAEAAPAAAGRTRTDTGAVASLQTRWRYRVVDLALVPPEFLMLDDTAVQADINAGTREIPGLEVYAESNVRVRSI